MRCRKCGLLYLGNRPIRCPVCKTIIRPRKTLISPMKRVHRCYRCGRPTNAMNPLCWECESKARKVLRVKPEWKKTYKKEMIAQGGRRVGKPIAPDRR